MRKFFKIAFICTIMFFISPMLYGGEIHKAASSGDLQKLKELIDEGTDINSYGKNPKTKYDLPHGTPLHWAVTSDQKEAVLFLIKNGADVNAKTYDGVSQIVETPLELAVWNRNIRLARIMLEAGADVKGAGHELHWPLLGAVVNEDFEMVKLLLDYGADIYRTGIEDYTVLHHAVLEEKKDAVRYLLSSGFDVNAPRIGAIGGTALHVAARSGNIEMGNGAFLGQCLNSCLYYTTCGNRVNNH